MKRIVLLLLAISLLLASCSLHFRMNTAERKTVGNQTTVEIAVDRSYVEEKGIDGITIESYLVDRSGIPVRKASAQYSQNQIQGKDKLDFDLENYGKSELTIYYKKGGSVLKKDYEDYVLTADRYNIGMIIATLPVTDFTMLMMDRDGDGSIIDPTLPTIVSLGRGTSYNFDKMLDNMYALPFVSEEKLKTANASQNGRNYQDLFLKATYDYIGYLHELNPESTFNVIAYDRSPEAAILMLYCNGLDPKENRITLLSDGTATYSDFQSVYGAEAGQGLGLYESYVKKWAEIKKRALSGDVGFASVEKPGCYPYAATDVDLVAYNVVMANDDDIDFKWVFSRNREDTFGSSDVYVQKVKNCPNAIQLNLSDYVKAGGKLDDNEKEDLKAIFNFNDDVFEEAEKENKKCMIFLGTSTGTEKDTLEDYLLFITNYLDKDEYAFFYKGHPGHIFSYPERNEIAERTGMKILDPAIPAELFVLFKPEVDMCGYPSSTFYVYPAGTYKPVFVSDGSYDGDVYVKQKNSDGTYDFVRKSDNKMMHWNPKNPGEMNWVDNA